MDIQISLEKIFAGYDSKIVLQDINLTIHDRDFLGIIGPNGGGKTTLIKIVLGLLKPLSGHVCFYQNAQPIDSLRMGYLPQYSSIDRKFPISVEEVILSGLNSRKSLTSRFTRQQKEKVQQVVSQMGLDGLNKKAIGQLSGGELQRALLGRAIVSNPQVVILDEPSTYIDPQFETRLYELLTEINKNCTIILVSHDIDTVLERAKSIVSIDKTLKYLRTDEDIL